MKTLNLVSKSTLLYFRSNKYVSTSELSEYRKFYLFLNSISPSTYESHHPSDPLLKALEAHLKQPEPFCSRMAMQARYFLGKLQRRLTTPKVLRDDLPRCEPAVRPIRLIDPDKVTGIFYDKNNRLH